MADIHKSDAQAAAFANIVNKANTSNYQGGTPFGSNGGQAYARAEMLDWYDNPPALAQITNYLSGDLNRAQMLQAAKNLAIHYARIVRGLYGLTGTTTSGAYVIYPWSAYEVFFVKAEFHASHYNAVVAAIDADAAGEVSGAPSLAQLQAYFLRLFNIINNNKDTVSVDLRVCHTSCHANCHGSRGRR